MHWCCSGRTKGCNDVALGPSRATREDQELHCLEGCNDVALGGPMWSNDVACVGPGIATV